MDEEQLEADGLELESQEDETQEEQAVEEIQPAPGDYMSRDAWEKSGRDPDDYLSKKKFDEQGQIINDIKILHQEKREFSAKISALEADTNVRLENQRKLLEAQNKMAVDNLKRDRQSAIEDADVDKAGQIQDQIDSLSQQDTSPPPPKPPEQGKQFTPEELNLVEGFNRENPWVKTDSAKADRMIKQFNVYGNRGMSVQDAITNAKADIDREFPSVNPRRSEAAAVEGGRSKPGKSGKARVHTWNDLTSDEKRSFNLTGGISTWETKEAFVQTAIDCREKAS